MTSPMRAYAVGTAIAMVAYVVCIVIAVLVRETGALGGPALYAVAILPALPILAQLGVTLRLMTAADEFVRGLMARRFVIAASLLFAAATVWGFLETFADAPHAPSYLAYPGFWGAYGLVSPFVRSTR